MNRKFSIGDVFVNLKTSEVYQYIKLSEKIEKIEHNYILQCLDGETWFDAWRNKESADDDLFTLVTRGDLDHYKNWAITVREEQVVMTEKTIESCKIGFKGGE